MKHFSLFRWFKDVSITKKLYFTVGIMALLICVELFALYFSLNTLSSVGRTSAVKVSGRRLRRMRCFICLSMACLGMTKIIVFFNNS
jgi:hypothetical protein